MRDHFDAADAQPDPEILNTHVSKFFEDVGLIIKAGKDDEKAKEEEKTQREEWVGPLCKQGIVSVKHLAQASRAEILDCYNGDKEKMATIEGLLQKEGGLHLDMQFEPDIGTLNKDIYLFFAEAGFNMDRIKELTIPLHEHGIFRIGQLVQLSPNDALECYGNDEEKVSTMENLLQRQRLHLGMQLTHCETRAQGNGCHLFVPLSVVPG